MHFPVASRCVPYLAQMHFQEVEFSKYQAFISVPALRQDLFITARARGRDEQY
jgi:hypothetical protein